MEGPSLAVNVSIQNTTTDGSLCGLICPSNRDEDSIHNGYQYQPCFYTVRVGEVFKGNYSVSTSCVYRNR